MMLTEIEQKVNRVYDLIDKLVGDGTLSPENMDTVCDEINTLCRSIKESRVNE